MDFDPTSDFNKQLRSILKEIYPNTIMIQSKDVFRERKEILKNFLFNFKNFANENCPVFRKLFSRYLMIGSAYEGLKVKEPDEFDINIVLKFPEYCNLKFKQGISCHGTCQIISEENYFPGNNFVDSSGYLLPKNMRSWLQRLVDKFIQSYDKPSVITEIKAKDSGPARTLKIQLGTVWISVDLVPVIQITDNSLRLPTKLYEIVDAEFMKRFCLVPKPVTHMAELSEIESSRLWRMHFAQAELNLLKQRWALKPVIKILKALRDSENWQIPSYFLKTLAFQMIIENYPSPKHFREKFMGIRFMQLLESLKTSLDARYLGSTFFPSFNLFHTLNDITMSDISNRISHILSKIRQDPYCLKSLLHFKSHVKKSKKLVRYQSPGMLLSRSEIKSMRKFLNDQK